MLIIICATEVSSESVGFLALHIALRIPVVFMVADGLNLELLPALKMHLLKLHNAKAFLQKNIGAQEVLGPGRRQ